MNPAELSRITRADGPFVSLYIDSSSSDENPQQRLELHWRAARERLKEVDPVVVDMVGGAVADLTHAGGDTVVVITGGRELLLATHLPDAPKTDVVRAGALPSLGPLLQYCQHLVPHVVVLADREGADILAVGNGDKIAMDSFEGSTEPIRKVQPGGWSQRRYQRRAENTWDKNAAGVAEEVAEIAHRIHAKLIVAFGDVRALSFLPEHLPTDVLPLLQIMDGDYRTQDHPFDHVEGPVRKIVNTAVAEQTVRILERFEKERSTSGPAANGPAAVVRALQAGAVDTLLVHDDPDDERSAWFGADPRVVALEAGADGANRGRLFDVLVRSAFGTDASIRIVPGAGPHTPAEGVGALLRFRPEG